jgi:hypothetical protein
MTVWHPLAAAFEELLRHLELIQSIGLEMLLICTVVISVSALSPRIERSALGGIAAGILVVIGNILLFMGELVRDLVVLLSTVVLLTVSVWIVIVSINDIVNDELS